MTRESAGMKSQATVYHCCTNFFLLLFSFFSSFFFLFFLSLSLSLSHLVTVDRQPDKAPNHFVRNSVKLIRRPCRGYKFPEHRVLLIVAIHHSFVPRKKPRPLESVLSVCVRVPVSQLAGRIVGNVCISIYL